MEMVNGYRCKDCTDVAYAKKNIDPAHPQDGPNGVDSPEKAAAATAAKEANSGASRLAFDPAVVFDGALKGLRPSSSTSFAPTPQTGGLVNLTA